MLPTYNERENILQVVPEILRQHDGIHVLVVDDSSPDGTGETADRLSAQNPGRVFVLHRTEKKGRGFAGAAGFNWALEHGYDIVVEMDADCSHNPKYIPDFLKALEDADMVLGSRQISGGGQVGRHPFRRILTRLATLYTRVILGLNVLDTNSGYRGFRRKVLEGINPDKLWSPGPGIVQEVLFKAHVKGFKIKEIPIVFEERKSGESKVRLNVIINGCITVLKLKLMQLSGKL